jgi:hypothetical protein
MFRASLLLAVLLSTFSVAAQIHIGAGVALGVQPFNGDQTPRVLPSVDLLVRGNSFGVQAAVEVTEIPDADTLVAGHFDVIYRRGDEYFFLAGAGPSILDVESRETTWNAMAEFGRAWKNSELFLRARYYDYRIIRAHNSPASPAGPAIYAGYRISLRR